MEVTDGNDGAPAAGTSIAVAATIQLFLCTPETLHIGTNRAHTPGALLKKRHNYRHTKVLGATRRDPMSRLHVGVPPTKLVLRLIEQVLA